MCLYSTVYARNDYVYDIWLFLYESNETVEMGHLYVSSIFRASGLYGVVWASIWGVQVDDSQLEIHRIFHTKKVLCITDIGKVIIDKKDAMILERN